MEYGTSKEAIHQRVARNKDTYYKKPITKSGQVKYKPKFILKGASGKLRDQTKICSSLRYLTGEREINQNKRRDWRLPFNIKKPIFRFSPWKNGECFRCGEKTYLTYCDGYKCKDEMITLTSRSRYWGTLFIDKEKDPIEYESICHQLFMEQTANEEQHIKDIINTRGVIV